MFQTFGLSCDGEDTFRRKSEVCWVWVEGDLGLEPAKWYLGFYQVKESVKEFGISGMQNPAETKTTEQSELMLCISLILSLCITALCYVLP